jgi:hypothetical protein
MFLTVRTKPSSNRHAHHSYVVILFFFERTAMYPMIDHVNVYWMTFCWFGSRSLFVFVCDFFCFVPLGCCFFSCAEVCFGFLFKGRKCYASTCAFFFTVGDVRLFFFVVGDVCLFFFVFGDICAVLSVGCDVCTFSSRSCDWLSVAKNVRQESAGCVSMFGL